MYSDRKSANCWGGFLVFSCLLLLPVLASAHCQGSHSLKYGYPECQTRGHEEEGSSISDEVVAGAKKGIFYITVGIKEGICMRMPTGLCELLDPEFHVNITKIYVMKFLAYNDCGASGNFSQAKQFAELRITPKCPEAYDLVVRAGFIDFFKGR